jgi:hypothetical protein
MSGFILASIFFTSALLLSFYSNSPRTGGGENIENARAVCDAQLQDVQWTIMQVELSDKTIRDLEALLAKRGQNGNVSEFIDRTLQRALFFETVREVKRQNTSVDPQQLDRLIDEAVAAARSGPSRTNSDANGA